MKRIGVLLAVLALAAAACKSGGGVETVANSEPTGAPPAAEATATEAVEAQPTAEPTIAPEPPTATATQAAEVTALASLLDQAALAPSARMEGSMTITGIPGAAGDFTMPFSGAFDNVTGNSSMKMDMSGVAALAGDELPPGFEDLFGEMEMRIIGDAAYMKFPFFAAFLGAETEWVVLTAEDAGATVSGFSGGISPANPIESLELFSESFGSVTEVGRETVRGVNTTHYLVRVDMQALLETASPQELAELQAQGPLPFDELPLELWIGDDGLMYRYRMEISGDSVATAPGESFGTMTMVLEIYDYGATINIEPPPADQVTDMSELGGLFGF